MRLTQPRCPRCGSSADAGTDNWTCRYCRYEVSTRWTGWGLFMLGALAGSVGLFAWLTVSQPTSSAVIWLPVMYLLGLAGACYVFKQGVDS